VPQGATRVDDWYREAAMAGMRLESIAGWGQLRSLANVWLMEIKTLQFNFDLNKCLLKRVKSILCGQARLPGPH